jgi:nucleoside-triphosphatase
MEPKNILFTGSPGCGKSTLIEKIVRQARRPSTGFFTREIREEGRRVGFSINTLDGRLGLLAHRDIKSPYRVGRYGVNLKDIERIAVPSMVPENEDTIIVVDEVGKMECYSRLFRDILTQILDSRNPVVGSISLEGPSFIQRIKERDDILLIRVSEQNRDSLFKEYPLILGA